MHICLSPKLLCPIYIFTLLLLLFFPSAAAVPSVASEVSKPATHAGPLEVDPGPLEDMAERLRRLAITLESKEDFKLIISLLMNIKY